MGIPYKKNQTMCVIILQFLQLGLVGYPFPYAGSWLTAETENGKPWDLDIPMRFVSVLNYTPII